MPDTTARDAKLIQYLNEAYAMEMHLETALQAHISMTTETKYRQRLKEHLTETKRHAREVRQRVKKLGGTPETLPVPGPDLISEAAGALLGGAEKAVALAQGPLHALRGTSREERQLKNAKTEYASEAQEIATYRGIQALAEALADSETARLARTISREEERMRSFLEREIPLLAKAVVSAEIPAADRRPASRKGGTGKTTRAGKAGASTRTGSRGARTKATRAAKAASRPGSPAARSRAKATSRAKAASSASRPQSAARSARK